MKLFKTYSEKEVKRVQPLVDKINGLEESMTKLIDSDLRAKTEYFKNQLKEGKTLDDILPEAFAVVREASKRVLGMQIFSLLISAVWEGWRRCRLQSGDPAVWLRLWRLRAVREREPYLVRTGSGRLLETQA